ncbi:MAG: Tm-1-like ATP-binding domain-containing protein [Pirellulales bacterium]|nr:Tm-1-like ATP-binding domain-containing protein [Pirellulales bacterium]
MHVYLIATLDTKGPEAALLRDLLASAGESVRVIDAGSVGDPAFKPDVTREEVFAAAGTTLVDIAARRDRGEAVTNAAQGAAALARQLYAEGQLAGVIALGGSAGTTIGTAAMRALPIGVPKLMISTLASGQVRHYVGDKDILMLNSIVDLAGVNRLTRLVLATAARAMTGLVTFDLAAAIGPQSDKPLVAATMFGVTTPCVERARTLLEAAGYEVLVFHATGSGGQAMESLVADGLLAGVLDITTTELADELVGGVLSAGPERLTAAARHGVPQVVSAGALDMVNFHARATVPVKFAERKFYQHNPSVTLMRTTPSENLELGRQLGRKVAMSSGPAAILLPARGVSAIDREGGPFDDPAARRELFAGVRQTAGPIDVLELDCHINDAEFAEAAANRLIELMQLSLPDRDRL